MIGLICLNNHVNFRFIGVVILFVLSGCAINSANYPGEFPVLQNGTQIPVQNTEVLSLSEEMSAFVQRYVPSGASDEHKLRMLSQAIIQPGVLGFSYEQNLTLTAQQAFHKRQGNCLAFANMFVALARAADLKAFYQEAKVSPDWNQESDVYIMARHVNVLVKTRSGDYVVDIANPYARSRYSVKVISDAYAKAQYFNNLGVDALLEGKMSKAHGYFVQAVRIEPKSGYMWSNLGVIYSRNGQLDEAKWAYNTALNVDSRTFVAMNNLSKIYQQQGDLEQASLLQTKVKKHLRDNPYYLLMLSDQAVAERRYKDAVKLLRRALRKKQDEHRLHFAIAKSLYLLGQRYEAEKSFSRARELAPKQLLKEDYSKQLSELVQ